MPARSSRRQFIRGSAFLAGAATFGTLSLGASTEPATREAQGSLVTPGEDLMREHGVLKRVMLAYEEILREFEQKQLAPEVVASSLKSSAEIIRDFIEDYHEKLEEDHLFPRLRTAGQLVDLVTTLKVQHDIGRRLTASILERANSKSMKDAAEAIRQFNRMYAPHEAREDTVLFPAFAKLLSRKEYEDLGEKFEQIEHQKFGQEGFEKMVNKVTEIEKQLGIDDLRKFTAIPKA